MPYGTVPSVTVASTAVNAAGAATTTTSYVVNNFDTVLVFAYVRSGAAFTDTATMSGHGMTWTKIAGFVSGNDYAVAFYGYGTPTNPGVSATDTLTFSRTPSSGRYNILTVSFSQDGTNNPIYASGSTNGTGTSGSITWSPSSDPTVAGQTSVGLWAHAAAEATTPDSTGQTWTELSDATTTFGLETQYLRDVADSPHTASWTSNVVYAGWVVQFTKDPLLGKKETVTNKLAYKGATVPELDDSDVWAVID